ncbi:MAG: glycosyltransferase family 4 protein [Verrucomicrobiae bacterium]|nr:glycosyltransferase family 4 protein [Verrucomicrobiae bacterium]MCP5538766.1 glycosyltransferase family 4 protein [Akkermansiaceae bacterium]MCP5549522.1 glycosyltransferase family 4 protein [Akkermansiaceae bacterium]
MTPHENGNDNDDDRPAPGVGYLLIGGPLVGSRVRDTRLANELVRRGRPGHAWWAMDRPDESGLDPAIGQDWLFHSSRNAANLHGPTMERVGRLLARTTSDARREAFSQKRSWFLARQLRHLVQRVCAGVETDPGLIRRFARQIDAARVGHLLPNLAIFAPFAAAAIRRTRAAVRYTVTFQGYELYSRYAREIGLEKRLFQRFREAVEASHTPAVAVSEDYRRRVHDEVGVPLENLVVVPPGVPEETPLPGARARELVAAALPAYDPGLPLIAYLGRRDSEKGIDLLLYAARLLRARGAGVPPFQIAVCGGTAFGGEYATVLRQLADQLGVPVLWHGRMSHELRTALFQTCHATVYPSVHREPFGMVPVESMMLGTPAVVADTGGVSELVAGPDENGAEIRGGLAFRSWDSADLAEKLASLLADAPLHARLRAAAPGLARRYSVARLADRTLELIDGATE